jgi:hypothetical protein
MSIKNKKQSNTYSESTEEHYKHVPMDLNSSPLEELFRDMFISTANTTTTAVESVVSPKAKPVSIPGANTKNNSVKRSRKRGAHSVPNSICNPLNYDKRIPAPSTQSNNRSPQLDVFIVGSLEEKPPVPWPSSLTLPHDKSPSQHYKTMDWPASYHQGARSAGGDDDQSVFSMDDDYQSASDFHDDDEEALAF